MHKDPQAGAIMLAGGKGSRLHELTAGTCKPALPVGPVDRIVDWTLGNLRRSGILDLTVATQYMATPLDAHLRRHWQAHFGGRMRIVHGVAATGTPAGYAGTADAARHLLDHVGGPEDAPLLVVAADHVYDMDYRPMIAAHVDSGAGITVACTVLPSTEARGYGVIAADPSGRVRAFDEKPDQPVETADQPGRSLVSMGIYVCNRKWLRVALAQGGNDFGYDILPAAVATGEAQAFRAVTPDGAPIYWKDLGTLDAYREVAVELALNPWRCPPRRVSGGLPADAETRRWARQGSVVMPGASVAPDADLHDVIVAPGAQVPAGITIGEVPESDRRWFRVTPSGTTLVTAAMLDRRLRAVPAWRDAIALTVDADGPASRLGP